MITKKSPFTHIALLLAVVLNMAAATQALAGHVTPEQAEQTARVFLDSRHRGGQSQTLKMARRQPLLQTPVAAAAYYVFNVGQAGGFVMVSGDDRTPAILGYADSGTFDADQLPSHVRAWFDGYADQLSYLEQTDGRYEALRLADDRAAVSPLLTSRWNQGAPYNDACPVDPDTGERSVTGCVATAMAQVLNYYQWPERTLTTIPGYTTSTRQMSRPAIPPTDIDWDLMRDSYGGPTAETQRQAVANLMMLCGHSVEMDYKSESSGAYTQDLVNAFQTYFGYDPSTRIVLRSHYDAAQWETMIYNEVAEGRPVLYSGQSEGGGHSFVVDGYDGNGRFHINWGWGGMSDGYFVLSVLNPNSTSGIGSSGTTDGYSYSQDAIIGLQHGSDAVANEGLTVYSLSVSGSQSFTRSSRSRDFSNITLKADMYNMSGMTHVFGIGYMLYGADDSPADNQLLGYYEGVELQNYWGWGGEYALEMDLSFGAGLADGDYYIVPVSHSENSDQWQPSHGADVWRIKATIDGMTLTLAEPQMSLSATLSATGSKEVNRSLPLTATVTNNGSKFNGSVYLFVDGTRMGGRTLTLDGSETANLEIDFIPTSTGNKQLSLAYIDNDKYVVFARTSVNVGYAQPSNLSATFNVANLSGGVLRESHASVDITVTNRGSRSYEQPVNIAIMRYSAEDNMYYAFSALPQNLNLAAGESTTLHTDFYDVPDGINCLVGLRCVSSGQWLWLYDLNTTFDVSYTCQPLLLTKSLTLDNGDADNVLQEPVAELTAVITNNGDADAKGENIALQIYKLDADSYDKVWELPVAADIPQGERATLQLTTDSLEAGATYKACMAYKNGNSTFVTDTAVTVSFSIATPPLVSGLVRIPQTDHLTISVARDSTVLADGDLVTVGDTLTITYTAEEGYRIKDHSADSLVVTVTLTEDDFTSEDDSLVYTVPVCEVELATLKGDVNLDGKVGIGDIVAVTNVMAGSETDSAIVARANVNGDDNVGIGDIVAITNIMAGSE